MEQVLDNMEVPVIAVPVALFGITETGDMAVFVRFVNLFAVIGVFEIVVGRDVIDPRGGLPAAVPPGEAQKFVVSIEAADTLYVVQTEPFPAGGACSQRHGSAEAAAGDAARAGPVVQAGVVDQVRGDQ